MTRLTLAFSAALWAAAFSIVALLPGCGDDEPEGACQVGDDSTCPAGGTCQAGPDGVPACFCNAATGTGCGPGLECQAVDGSTPACFCNNQAQTGCEDGLVCEEVVGGNAGCFAPLTVTGSVIDLETEAAIPDARVVARDANNAAVSDVAITDEMGNYSLTVLTPRNLDGSPAEFEVALRADALGYLPFPRAPRVALPFDMAEASGNPPTVQNAATDVALIALDDTSGLGTVQGTVLSDAPRGTLVVAGGGENGGGVTGIAGFDGTYTVFNVPSGSVSVQGYKAGIDLSPASADVPAGDVVTGVDLGVVGFTNAIVSGKIEIVNPGDGDDTSVILVVEETFVESIAAGEAPPGLRAFPVDGDFQIAGVPAGNYVVLAAFENDFLVRDPDQSIGGTSIVRITVAGDTPLQESFKVTGALDVVSPDNEEVVTGTPEFVFADDSGEDSYDLQVYDAFGTLVWESVGLPKVTGSATVTVPYEGPALESGSLYQFRATSFKQGGSPISRTEDLRGVFVFE